jgi:predicted O-methyltransferase YrrM
MNNIKRVSAIEACDLVAKALGANERKFYGYYTDEFDWNFHLRDDLGWSMPASEAALLYAAVRVVQPRTILELGTHVGYSASCFEKAMERNGFGRLVTLDYKPLLSENTDLTKSYRVFPITTDGVEFSRTLQFPVDMIFEDGNHTTVVTREFLKNCLPHLRPGGVVFVHDVAHPKCGKAVTEGMRQSLGEDFERLVIDESTKGLGFWIKNA